MISLEIKIITRFCYKIQARFEISNFELDSVILNLKNAISVNDIKTTSDISEQDRIHNNRISQCTKPRYCIDHQ